MSRKTVWVTGAGGLIGSHLVRTASTHAPSWQVHSPSRAQLNLTDFRAVRATFRQHRPDLLIHCAALSKPETCEREPEHAHKINVQVTRVLAELAANIPFIFFSSDLVFDGRKGNYDEFDAVNPLNVYAKTKVVAEEIVLANPEHIVIRTSLTGGISPTGDRGFNEQMRRAWEAGATLRLFTDEFRSPLPATVTAQAIWELAKKYYPGLYHLAGAERLSRWQIGQVLAARWPHLRPGLQPALQWEYSGPARPPDVSLNCAKIQTILSFRLPGLTDWLAMHPEEPF